MAVLLAGAVASLSGLQAPKTTPAIFLDATAKSGITFVHASGATPEKYMVETFGSGVAWIDIDNDGFVDLYFVNGAPGASNALYRNNGDGTFSDVTRQSGTAADASRAYKTGVAVGDYDNDGRLDLYVTALGPNILYRNNGNGTFVDVTGAAGVAGGANEWSTSTGFLDYDRDGDLDLYVANYVDARMDANPGVDCENQGIGCTAIRRFSTGLPTVSSATTATGRSRTSPFRQASRIPLERGSASSSAISIAMQTPISTWPTIWFATSCTATTATARFSTSRTLPVSVSTRMENRRRAWVSTAAMSMETDFPSSSSRTSPTS